MNKGDPIIQIFGKDIASLIYRFVHQILYSTVVAEYHDLQVFPVFNGYAMTVGIGEIKVYNYRDFTKDCTCDGVD